MDIKHYSGFSSTGVFWWVQKNILELSKQREVGPKHIQYDGTGVSEAVKALKYRFGDRKSK